MATKENKTLFKYLLGRIHLWGGLGSGIIVFVVSITGCIYVFEEEFRNYTQQRYRFVTPLPDQRPSLTNIIHNMQEEFPAKHIEQIRLFEDPSKAAIVKITDQRESKNAKGREKSEKQAFPVHPATGKLLSRHDLEHDFMHLVEDIHKTLLLGEAGKWIIRINIVVFLVMLLSGLYLWWPAKKNQRKTAFKPKLTGKFQIVNYSLHNSLGFYFLMPLLLITLTGIWWAVKPVQKWVYAAFGAPDQKPAKYLSEPSAEKIFDPEATFKHVANGYAGWNEAHLNFPKNASDPFKINLKYPYEIYKKQNVFEFDRYSGKLLASQLYDDYSTADKIKHANRDLHTGQNYGIVGKLLAFFSSLFAASLPVTGFLIWYQRKFKAKRKPAKVASAGQSAPINKASRPMIKRHPVSKVL